MRKQSANIPSLTQIIHKQTYSSPQTGTEPRSRQSFKSIVRNILLARPDFPRLYADVVISSRPNSNLAKVLAANYTKIIGVNMPAKLCTHIKVTGVQCGSPALRGDQFCYFHKRLIDGVKVPDSRVHPFAILEDEESIQASLMEIINSLLRGTIELKRAELILRALNTAVRNSRRVKFNLASDMVRELTADDEPVPEPAATPARVETAAPGSLPRTESRSSSGPEVSGRGALASAPAVNQAIAAQRSFQPPAKSETLPDPTRPKPPVSVPRPPDIKKKVATGKG